MTFEVGLLQRGWQICLAVWKWIVLALAAEILFSLVRAEVHTSVSQGNLSALWGFISDFGFMSLAQIAWLLPSFYGYNVLFEVTLDEAEKKKSFWKFVFLLLLIGVVLIVVFFPVGLFAWDIEPMVLWYLAYALLFVAMMLATFLTLTIPASFIAGHFQWSLAGVKIELLRAWRQIGYILKAMLFGIGVSLLLASVGVLVLILGIMVLFQIPFDETYRAVLYEDVILDLFTLPSLILANMLTVVISSRAFMRDMTDRGKEEEG